MCFGLPLGQTDRNTCLVIMTIFFNFNKIISSYNGFATDFLILPVLDHFDDDFDRFGRYIEARSEFHPVWYMKNMSALYFGVTRSITGFVVAT
jgi:hypothetical protein